MELFRPEGPKDFSVADVERHFANSLIEWRSVPFSDAERNLLESVMLRELLDTRMRPFFLYHFGPLIEKAVSVFFRNCTKPCILELGCGSGSTSILFALLGAKVVGIDLETDLISACEKRRAFYERHFGSLDLLFCRANALEFQYQRVGPVDGIYSLFAFNTMQPSAKLLARVLPTLKPGGNLVVTDGNRQSLYNRLFRPRGVLTPRQMESELIAHGCRVVETLFDCVVPPAVCRIRPAFQVALKLERLLKRLGVMPWLGLSYTIVAERLGDKGGIAREMYEAPPEPKISASISRSEGDIGCA